MCSRRIVRRTEASMKPIAPLVIVGAALVLVLTTTWSWGQPVFFNPTVSDASRNTAGGTDALHACLGKTLAPCSGNNNTAFGLDALFSNATGFDNTATGFSAL